MVKELELELSGIFSDNFVFIKTRFAIHGLIQILKFVCIKSGHHLTS